MEAKTTDLAPTLRCHACWKRPSDRKELWEHEHRCEHCRVTCGRDENASRVLMRWLREELDVAGLTPRRDSGTLQDRIFLANRVVVSHLDTSFTYL